tara:strand:+ start:66 stop:698 length:633 start_codon:yes stop_codon:yes gene_type:complete
MSEIVVVKQFGPSIAKTKIPSDIVDYLNNYIDKITEDKKKSAELDHGNKLAGDVTQEFKLERDIINKSGWAKFLGQCVHKWIEIETTKKITEFNILNSWVVRQFENEYNPTHWHNGHISGAGFLKVPKNMGSFIQGNKKENYKGGNLQLIHGSNMFLSHSLINIIPKVGDFYFFPHYLMHTVLPFKGTNQERRSISFNALIDQNIYNVYG